MDVQLRKDERTKHFCVQCSFWRLVLVAFVAAFTVPVGYQLNQAVISEAWAHAVTNVQVLAACSFITPSAELSMLLQYALHVDDCHLPPVWETA